MGRGLTSEPGCPHPLLGSFMRIEKARGLSPSRQRFHFWRFLWLSDPGCFQPHFLRTPGWLCLHRLTKPMLYLPSWKLPPCRRYPTARCSQTGLSAAPLWTVCLLGQPGWGVPACPGSHVWDCSLMTFGRGRIRCREDASAPL